MRDRTMRKVFRVLNRYFMVPAYRLGLGPVVSNPLTGYIMLLKTVGRKTGRVRYVPVNYAIAGGCVYCASGWGAQSHWYANLRAHPQVDITLPGRTFRGEAQVVSDPEEWAPIVRQILKNGGFAGFFMGFNPYTVPEQVLREKSRELVVFRIRPLGIGSGPNDPGGWAWLWLNGLFLFWILRLLRKRRPSHHPPAPV